MSVTEDGQTEGFAAPSTGIKQALLPFCTAIVEFESMPPPRNSPETRRATHLPRRRCSNFNRAEWLLICASGLHVLSGKYEAISVFLAMLDLAAVRMGCHAADDIGQGCFQIATASRTSFSATLLGSHAATVQRGF
ncbi:hypothetical protein Daus18300_003082 [Diaporthe australafricana]|uniref:Uncharacterized protein n=1 Tax=Diaporthe australafricana TaxID=127596 RepID=A0ABR3XJH1_9PEZI